MELGILSFSSLRLLYFIWFPNSADLTKGKIDT